MDPIVLEAMVSSANEHWNTSLDILNPIWAAWSQIVLDPCSNATSIVNAIRSFSGPSVDFDGLKESWQCGGLVFVNPPYGRKIRPWLIKCAAEAEEARKLGNNTEFILLGPARTDTKWFQRVILPTADQVLLWEGRLTFLGAKHPALFPSFLGYWGHDQQKFLTAFNGKGWFMK